MPDPDLLCKCGKEGHEMDNLIRSVDKRCADILRTLTEGGDVLGVCAEKYPSGARLLDAGRKGSGSYAAGAYITELCQGGLAKAAISVGSLGPLLLPHITVESFSPRDANLVLQSAMAFEGQMISGPIKLFLGEDAPSTDGLTAALTAVIQGDEAPSDDWVISLAKKAGCRPDQLVLILVPQASAAGSTQIAGRMNENIIFTMENSLGYDASMVRHILGTCPIGPYGPPSEGKRLLLPDDYIHYAAGVTLTVDAPDGTDIQKLADDLAFDSLDIYGKLFAELLDEAGWDFFKIPNVMHINKLAEVTVTDIRSGRTARAGKCRPDLLTGELI